MVEDCSQVGRVPCNQVGRVLCSFSIGSRNISTSTEENYICQSFLMAVKFYGVDRAATKWRRVRPSPLVEHGRSKTLVSSSLCKHSGGDKWRSLVVVWILFPYMLHTQRHLCSQLLMHLSTFLISMPFTLQEGLLSLLPATLFLRDEHPKHIAQVWQKHFGCIYVKQKCK